MKKLFVIFLTLSVTCAADTARPQSDVASLRATIEEQQAALRYMRQVVDQLERRMAAVEDLPEIRIPRGVKNYMRQLHAAMDQFCLDHKITSCRFSDIVGPGKFVREVRPVDGESYADLRFSLDEPEWRIETKSGQIVIMKWPPFDEKQWNRLIGKEPNKAPEPTPTSVTPPAAQESGRP